MVDINKKLSELFGKMDQKMLEKRINTAIEMLKNGDVDELSKKINKIDKNELLEKINEFDESKLKEFNINKTKYVKKSPMQILASSHSYLANTATKL